MKNEKTKLLKTIGFFLLILLIYYIPAFIFKVDKAYYDSLVKINVPSWVFGVVWSIIYILMALYITIIYQGIIWPNRNHPKKKLTTYIIINYLIQASFIFFFFTLKSTLWGYIIAISTLVSLIFVFMESLLVNKKATYLLLPYLLWSIFASILAVTIFLWN